MKSPRESEEKTPQGVALRIIPNARKAGVAGMHGDAVKIKVLGPAIEGRANDELLELVAEIARCPIRNVKILSGAKSRGKVVSIEGLSGAELRRRLIASAV